jgi:hypothetical protein
MFRSCSSRAVQDHTNLNNGSLYVIQQFQRAAYKVARDTLWEVVNVI